MPPETKYPRYFQTIVGLDPGRMRQFRPEEVRALVEAYREFAGGEPLDPDFDVAGHWATLWRSR